MAEEESTTNETLFAPPEAAPAEAPAPAKKAAAKKAAPRKKAAPKAATKVAEQPETGADGAESAPPKKKPAKKAAKKKPAATESSPAQTSGTPATAEALETTGASSAAAAPRTMLLFQAPDPALAPVRPKKAAPSPAAEENADVPDDTPAPRKQNQPKKKAASAPAVASDDADSGRDQSGNRAGNQGNQGNQGNESDDADGDDDGTDEGGAKRRRRRGGRRRRKPGEGEDDQDQSAEDSESDQSDDESGDDADGDGDGTSRRRRRRRREGEGGPGTGDDPENTVTRVRKTRSAEDEITAVSGSTRLEAKKQRRREGREAGRRRAPIVSEAEFLARRESVERVMAIRQRGDVTQIGVIEDKVLVEHYVARESQTSLIGNVYLGRVQNVLPSMEAAFVDIGKGRNAVLYAGEVNWSALGHKDGAPRKIESVLSSGQTILVQVTKDPIGHKGARLTSQVSLAGRFLVYVPDGTTSGISRKLPDTERARLKALLKEIVPDTAGVIVRTAAEGASEEELTRDVERLKAHWDDIDGKSKGQAPKMLYGEPDLTLKVVRDLFTEDFAKLVIQGDDAWDTVQNYVSHVAPDLEDRLERYSSDVDIFTTYRVEEQIAKALDRKVWLPSGGSLIIDRTEAMTVVDVNTGKFTGSGGNLEETVTKNNLEAAEEVVRQLRLRDIGGIIVVDFIDMVLESNRDLVLRRMVECLGRDRTRHQVAEVTSLGLVQMTRKRIGTGLLESFSENCSHCQGRGVVIQDRPVDPNGSNDDEDGGARRGNNRRRGGRGRGQDGSNDGGNQGNQGGNGNHRNAPKPPSPADVAALAATAHADEDAKVEADEATTPVVEVSHDSEANTPVEVAPSTGSGRRSTGSTHESLGTPQAEESAVVESPEVEAASDSSEVSSALQVEPDETTSTSDEIAEAVVEPEARPEPEPEARPEPAAPVVITRTRRRSASRPAGPPVGSTAEVEAPTSSTDEVQAPTGSTEEVVVATDEVVVTGDTETSGEETGSAFTHVPVKRKGRKR